MAKKQPETTIDEQPSSPEDVNAQEQKKVEAERTKQRLVQIVFPVGMESAKTKLVEVADAYNISIPQAFVEIMSGEQADQAWTSVNGMIADYEIDEVRKANAVHEPKTVRQPTAASVSKQIAKLSDEEREALKRELLNQL